MAFTDLQPGQFFNATLPTLELADGLIDAFAIMVDRDDLHLYSFYDMLRAICPKNTPHEKVMAYTFALANIQHHYKKQYSLAVPSELVYPKGPDLLKQCVPELCFIFARSGQRFKIRNANNLYLDRLANNIMPSHIKLCVGRNNDEKGAFIRNHSNKICKQCIDLLGVSPQCYALLGVGNCVNDDPTHNGVAGETVNVHVPPPLVILTITIARYCDKEPFGSVLHHMPVEDALKFILSLQRYDMFALAELVACGLVSFVMMYIYANYIGFPPNLSRMDRSRPSISNCRMLGLFNPEMRSLPIEEVRRRVATMDSVLTETNPIATTLERIHGREPVKIKVQSLVLSGAMLVNQASETFQSGATVAITRDTIEALSIMCMANVAWLLEGFKAHTSNIKLQSLWSSDTLNLFNTDADRRANGEHAGCSQFGNVFVKWQFIFSFEIAHITKRPVIGGDKWVGTTATERNKMTTEQQIQEIIRTIGPTHTVALRTGSGIAREYENYNSVSHHPDFFCYPVFGIVTTANSDIRTSNVKVIPETCFRTELAELALVTVYPSYGLTLDDVITLSVLHNPVKIIATLCLLFLLRYQATGGRVWPDAHARNWTIRPAPKPVSITYNGMVISFIHGEQMVCAIDHGDDTPSRAADIGAACHVFNYTIRTIIRTHNHDFFITTISAKKRDEEVDPVQQNELVFLGIKDAMMAHADWLYSLLASDLSSCTYGLYRYAGLAAVKSLNDDKLRELNKNSTITKNTISFDATNYAFKSNDTALQIVHQMWLRRVDNSIESIEAAFVELHRLVEPRQTVLVTPLVAFDGDDHQTVEAADPNVRSKPWQRKLERLVLNTRDID